MVLQAIIIFHHSMISSFWIWSFFFHKMFKTHLQILICLCGWHHPYWNPITEINAIKTLMHSFFRIKDSGNLIHFLGLEVSLTTESIDLCQHKYTSDILNNMSLIIFKPSTTPMIKDSYLRLLSLHTIPLFLRFFGPL